jgi:hypothetical protein
MLELCLISRDSSGKVRHYFDVGVFGYGIRPVGGGQGVEPAFGGTLEGKPLVALPDLRDNPLRIQEVPSVETGRPPMKIPVWITPAHGHRTPMCEAIATAGQYIFEWASDHPDSFPPIIINITDGMVTDSPFDGATLAEWAQRLVGITTTDGPLLLFNIFLSPTAASGVLFPAEDNGLPEPGPDLFRISSTLPPLMAASARDAGAPVDTGARGLGFNADPLMLERFLDTVIRGSKFLFSARRDSLKAEEFSNGKDALERRSGIQEVGDATGAGKQEAQSANGPAN